MPSNTPIPESVRKKIIDLWQSGWSAGAIAKELGRTRESVCGFLWRQHLKRGEGKTVVCLPSYPPSRPKPQPVPCRRFLPDKGGAFPEPPVVEPLPHVDLASFQWRADDGCAWISGAPSSALHGGFCNCRVVPGTSWCPVHLQRVYEPWRPARGIIFRGSKWT